jgi:nicotinate-nucleotide pyrophosphorylase (carboxylating)
MTSQLIGEITDCLKRALSEDVGSGDVTTESIVPEDARLRGQIIAKQDGVIAGIDIAAEIFHLLDPEIRFTKIIAEGGHIEAGGLIAEADGSARSLLTGERTALNLLNRMSGIATLTRKFVDAVAHTHAIILDTRKTAPGLRALDKLAVRRGGAENHRLGLYDMILIKDNHIDFAGSIAEAVRRARAARTDLEIEVEARTIADVNEALDLGIKRILLDNMTVETMREAVVLNENRAKLEASGNVTLENVSEIAETGVDYISVGALTHSPASFDSSFKWVA